MTNAEERAAEAVSARMGWGWRGLTLAWAGLAVAVALRLRRESLEPAVILRDEDAHRRACLGFPLPVMLGGSQVEDCRDPDTGTRALSYRLPATRSQEEVYAYYDDYFRRSGFVPSDGDPGASPGGAQRAYHDAGRLRAITVSVRSEPPESDHHTVTLTVQPIPQDA
jgi:hypothetical protein